MLASSPERTESVRRRRSERLCLMVLADGAVTTHELPPSGRVILGREPSDSMSIVIASSQVSRQHAAIEVAHGELWIEDLGSRNGTRVRDDIVISGSRRALR